MFFLYDFVMCVLTMTMMIFNMVYSWKDCLIICFDDDDDFDVCLLYALLMIVFYDDDDDDELC